MSHGACYHRRAVRLIDCLCERFLTLLWPVFSHLSSTSRAGGNVQLEDLGGNALARAPWGRPPVCRFEEPPAPFRAPPGRTDRAQINPKLWLAEQARTGRPEVCPTRTSPLSRALRRP